MTFMPQMSLKSAPGGLGTGAADINLESTHQVINTLVEVLQRNFKEDTNYMRPLMPPQANILFVLDREAAQHMVTYMSAKLKEAGNFEEGEFRFTHKSGANGEMLQRLRLEFPDGVNTRIIRKMLAATVTLGRIMAS